MEEAQEQVIRRLGEEGIETLSTEELRLLPRSLLLYIYNYALDYIWEDLPEEWRRDPEFLQKRFLYHEEEEEVDLVDF